MFNAATCPAQRNPIRVNCFNNTTRNTEEPRVTGSTVRGLNLGRIKRFSHIHKRPYRLWGPPSLLIIRYRDCVSSVKRSECQVNSSLPSSGEVNPLNAELNPICYLLALLGAHHFLHVTRIRVKSLTLRLLMSYIYIYMTLAA